jgi:molybdopterin converting factor small subunit
VKIAVRLFANLADYRPTDMRGEAATVDLPEGATVGDLAHRLRIPDEVPRLTLVNGRDAGPGYRLAAGDVVSLFPPLAGG